MSISPQARDPPLSPRCSDPGNGNLAQQHVILSILTKSVLFLCCLGSGFVLVYFQSVLVPFTIAVFLSYLMEPLVQGVMRLLAIGCGKCCSPTWCPLTPDTPKEEQHRDNLLLGSVQNQALTAPPRTLRATVSITSARISGLPRAAVRSLSVLVVVVAGIGTISGLFVLIIVELETLAERLQSYGDQFSKAEHTANRVLNQFGLNVTQAESWLSNKIHDQIFLGDAASWAINFLWGLLLTIILSIFMLTTADMAASDDGSVSVQRKMGSQIRRYIQLKSAVCIGLGISMALFLFIIGCEAPLLFGGITWLVNYVPNFGCIAIYVLPLPAIFLNPAIGPTARFISCIFPFVLHTFVGTCVVHCNY